MFSLRLTEPQFRLDKHVRAVVAEFLRPHGLAAERTRRIPDRVAAELDSVGAQVLALDKPGDPLTSAVVLEALAYGDPGLAYAALPGLQTLLLVQAHGGPEQRRRLPELARVCSTRTSVLLYEGGAAGQGELQTRADRNGEGWSVTGRKVAVQNPHDARLRLLIARTNTGEPAAFFGAGDDTGSGLTVESATTETGVLGGGAAASGVVELDCFAADERDRLAATALELSRSIGAARLLLAAVQLGAACAATEYAGGWATERRAFGRTLNEYQGVAFLLVDCEASVEMARLQLWNAFETIAASDTEEAVDQTVSRAMRTAHDTAVECSRQGIQVLGVHGIVTEHPVERFWRTASTLSTIDFDPFADGSSLVRG